MLINRLANRKSHPPKLYDEVYRLKQICKGGDYHKRLREAKIFTVEDFLKALNRDPDSLCKVLKMNRQHNSWLKLTNHARDYILEDQLELKPYVSEDGNTLLFFNCVYDLVGAIFSGEFVASENFESHQKVLANKLKEQAYNILDVIPSSYVMKGNIPELIPEQASNQNANYDPMMSSSVDAITPYCEGAGTPYQQTVTSSIVPLQNPQCPEQASYPFELASTQRFQLDGFSEASTSSQPNIEPHHLPQLHQRMPHAYHGVGMDDDAAPEPQPWTDERGHE